MNLANETERPPAVRSIHLQGGCRAYDAEEGLQVEPRVSNGQVASLRTPSYGGAYGVLKKAGFILIGVDFYLDRAQVDGGLPPNWRAYHPTGQTAWPVAEQADTWSFLAHSAILKKNGQLWDVASRINHQLRTCDWRLRQVSECYRDQLRAKVRADKFVHGQRFADGFTWLGYLAIQSFLIDACVLRDYFAEYRALILAQAGLHKFKSKVTRIASLKKQYLDESPLSLPVDQALASDTAQGGWLHLLGSYRDLIVHFAPLASAGRQMYAVCVSLPLGETSALPSIKLPIPSDPDKISVQRATGEYWEDPEQNYARFLNAIEDTDAALDGLQYAHSSLGKLAGLASQLVEISPVKPEIPHLTDKDIVSLEIIKPTPQPESDG